MLATIMQVLDTSIANVALPHMQGSLSASQEEISWVLTSYIVAAAIMTPVTGWLVARLGRRTVFLISVAGFTFASMLCGAAATLPQIVVFRMLQGVFGAALVPLSQAVLLDIYPKEKHGSAMSIWSVGIMVAPILGPTIGGALTDSFNWRWVFYINLPIGIIAFFGILVFLTESKRDRGRPFDLFGFAFLSLAIGALQMVLDRGHSKDWFGSSEIVVEAGLALAAIWIFLVHMITAKKPFLTPAIFRDRNFVVANIFMFIASFIMYATLALFPAMLTMLNYPITTTGMLQAPRGIAMMLVMMMIGRFIGRVDVRFFLALAYGGMGFALWQMTGFSSAMDMWPFITAGVIQGLSFGFLFVPLNAVAFGSLKPEMRTEATALYSLIRNTGGSIGIAIAETVLGRSIQINHAVLAESVTPYNQALREPAVQSFWSLDTLGGLSALDHMVNAQAAMIGYNNNFKLMMIVCFCAIPLLMFLRPARRAGAPVPAPATE